VPDPGDVLTSAADAGNVARQGDGVQLEVAGVVVAGHGVASGASGDPRFPSGTIACQVAPFLALGVDLRPFHPATLNVATARPISLTQPDHRLRGVRWHDQRPPEDFTLLHARLRTAAGDEADVMLYVPDPATKPEHHQPPQVVEVLAPWLADVAENPHVTLILPRGRVVVG